MSATTSGALRRSQFVSPKSVPVELHCQNPECTAVLDISSIPVEYEAILRQLASVANLPVVGSSSTNTSTQSHSADNEIDNSSALGDVSASNSLDMDAFHNFAKKGDAVGFTILAEAELFSSVAAASLPQCDYCMQELLKSRTKIYQTISDKRDLAISIQNQIESNELDENVSPDSISRSKGMNRLGADELDSEERSLLKEIKRERKKYLRLLAEKKELDSLERSVKHLEQRALQLTSQTSMQIAQAREKMHTLLLRERHYRNFLSKLRLLNSPSDAYFIWHKGPYVTVNGARLGRLTSSPSEYNELNAALGSVALLLQHLSITLKFQSSKYRVYPLGSFSRLVAVSDRDDKNALDLFYVNSFLGGSKFNSAIKALMVCIAEIGAFAESLDPSFRMPYAMSASGDTVGDLSTVSSKDAVFVRALKFAITNLKWILSWSLKSSFTK